MLMGTFWCSSFCCPKHERGWSRGERSGPKKWEWWGRRCSSSCHWNGSLRERCCLLDNSTLRGYPVQSRLLCRGSGVGVLDPPQGCPRAAALMLLTVQGWRSWQHSSFFRGCLFVMFVSISLVSIWFMFKAVSILILAVFQIMSGMG